MNTHAHELELARNGFSAYRILVPAGATSLETKAAIVLQDYFKKVTGVRLPILKESTTQLVAKSFLIGNTAFSNKNKINSYVNEGYQIRTLSSAIVIKGNGKKGTLYGVYEFIERFMGCRKWDNHPAIFSKQSILTIPALINLQEQPAFQYREVYFPSAFDDEFLDWHKLHRFEEKWGLWGHSFYKLVPPQRYFRDHPEYFSLVEGVRTAQQLCLSNPAVLKITIAEIQSRINENPNATYWSVSPNDDNGNCECQACGALDAADGGPQGSLLYFVNAIAARFPDKNFTTLAYGYSANATTVTKPAANVVIMLSNINATRSVPLEYNPSAASFRNQILQWKNKTPRVFVWDYCTQFTNFLTPFPIVQNFGPNLGFMHQNGISGVFEQGSADTRSDMDALKSYVLAKLLWNPSANADSLIRHFLKSYYGNAFVDIASYMELLQQKIKETNTQLDIYGNPVNDHQGYLMSAQLDRMNSILQSAEEKVAGDTMLLRRIAEVRLGHQFVVLQQAKFYGIEPYGIFEYDAKRSYPIRAGMREQVSHFVNASIGLGVKELSEGGKSPLQYAKEWESIFDAGVRENLAANTTVSLAHPYVPEYRSKRERTLVDRTPGYDDFSFNWLCFYENPMEANVDMGDTKRVKSISLHFLEDARHWIFRPKSILVSVSSDGINYRELPPVIHAGLEEDYTVASLPFRFQVNDNIRYIKVQALNWPELPPWRKHKSKKSMIACDEIWVE